MPILDVLPIIVQLVIMGLLLPSLPPWQKIPPPTFAELKLIVQFVIIGLLPSMQVIPPPLVAELLLMVQL